MRLESDEEKIRDLNPTAIRIPSALKERLKKEAKKNNRSMNAEIVSRLASSVVDDPMRSRFPSPAAGSEEANMLTELVRLIEKYSGK